MARGERSMAVRHWVWGVARNCGFLICWRWSWCERLCWVGQCRHGLGTISRLHWYRLVGRILDCLVTLRMPWCCSWLLRVPLLIGGDHCGVGGGCNHRSGLAAHLVQAAAGTDAANDDDEQNEEKRTKD